MTYDDWKSSAPADDGIPCRNCGADEAAEGSWLCEQCGELDDLQITDP